MTFTSISMHDGALPLRPQIDYDEVSAANDKLGADPVRAAQADGSALEQSY